jgi:hypothetical protein
VASLPIACYRAIGGVVVAAKALCVIQPPAIECFIAEWQRLKALVPDSVSSPITRRVYNMVLDEFIGWYRQELRPGFTKTTVSA